MTKPYTYDELRKIVVETPVEGSIVMTILNLVADLTDEYYEAGLLQGYDDGYTTRCEEEG